MEEQQVQMAISGLANAEAGDRVLDAERVFELANKAYSVYISQYPVEKGQTAQNAVFELFCRRRKHNP